MLYYGCELREEVSLVKKVIVLLLFLTIIFIIWENFSFLFVEDEVLGQIPDEDLNSNNSIMVYSPLNEKIIIPIVKEFQETTGIQVNYLSSGTGNLLKLLEQKEDMPLMDVMWGGSREFLDLHLDLFQPYKTIHRDKLSPDFRHAEDYWNGFNILPIVFMYNKKLVDEEDIPKSWEDLLDPKWKGKIAYADPNNSGSSFMILSALLTLNTDGEEYNWENIEKFIDNLEGRILPKSSDVYNGIANGDFAMGPTMEEAVVRLINQGADVGIVYPEEGTVFITDAVALMKDAENPEAAKIFIDFVLSKKIQGYMVDNFLLRSIRDDIIFPDGLIPMSEMNIMESDATQIYENKDTILDIWDSLVN